MFEPRPGDDGRILRPADLPTPFSADEIRDATPDGHLVETVVDEDGTVVGRRRTTFLDGDGTGVTMRLDAFDADGRPTGEPAMFRTEWIDLQAHASFPATAAERSWERIDTPLGRLECIRYDVQGDAAMSFWFAVDHPGMPVVMTATANGTVTTTRVVAITDA
jgi:hypothetical protein